MGRTIKVMEMSPPDPNAMSAADLEALCKIARASLGEDAQVSFVRVTFGGKIKMIRFRAAEVTDAR